MIYYWSLVNKQIPINEVNAESYQNSIIMNNRYTTSSNIQIQLFLLFQVLVISTERILLVTIEIDLILIYARSRKYNVIYGIYDRLMSPVADCNITVP